MNRNRLGQKHRYHNRRKSIIGAAMGITAGLVVVAMIIFNEDRRELDNDGCPVDRRYEDQIAIVIDQSDTLSHIQIESAVGHVMNIVAASPQYSELAFYTTRQVRHNDTKAGYRVCVPRVPDENDGSFTANPQQIRRRYNNFVTSVDAKINELLRQTGDDQSPIIEGMQMAKNNAFGSSSMAPTRKIIILVSDMDQNSTYWSFYRPTDGPDFEALIDSGRYERLRMDLGSVEVLAVVIGRIRMEGYARPLPDQYKRFWEDYFLDQGALPNARPRWIMVEG